MNENDLTIINALQKRLDRVEARNRALRALLGLLAVCA